MFILFRLLFIILIIFCLLNNCLARITTKSDDYSSHFSPNLALSLGYSLAQHYGVKDYGDSMSVKAGFLNGYTAGLSVKLPVTERFALMNEANFVMKGSSENITVTALGGEPLVKPAQMHVTYRINYVEFPMLTAYQIHQTEEVHLWMNGGIGMSIKVYGRHRLKGKIYFPETNGYSIIDIGEKSYLKDIHLFDYILIYGGEADIHLFKFCLSLGYRFTLGMQELRLPTYQTLGLSLVKLNNLNYLFYLKVPIW